VTSGRSVVTCTIKTDVLSVTSGRSVVLCTNKIDLLSVTSCRSWLPAPIKLTFCQ
jgi:hypothetical protein